MGKKLLREMVLPVVVALGEADAQCAAIAHEYRDVVIGVVTDDIDPQLYCDINILRMISMKSEEFINKYGQY